MAISAIFPEGVFPAGLFAGFPEIGGIIYPTIRYTWEENMVFQQFIGDTAKWPFQVLDSSGVVVESLAAPVVSVSVNSGSITEADFVISAFNPIMGTFSLEVPDAIGGVDMTSGDLVEIAINDTNGRGHLTIQFISKEVTATGGSAEKIVPADKYAFDASESTITLASPYNTITVEQVISIRNLTKNMLLYDCTMTNRSSITIDAGVITHTYSGTMEDTDKLMIIVNKAE